MLGVSYSLNAVQYIVESQSAGSCHLVWPAAAVRRRKCCGKCRLPSAEVNVTMRTGNRMDSSLWLARNFPEVPVQYGGQPKLWDKAIRFLVSLLINQLTVCSISDNVPFCPTSSHKPKDIQFTITWGEQQIWGVFAWKMILTIDRLSVLLIFWISSHVKH